MNKVDINRNKLEIGDIVVLCDCAEAISRKFEFWEVYADNTFTDHSVFIRGLTSHKSDSFKCCYLKKVDKKYKELVDKATSKKPIYEADGYDENGELIYDTAYCPNRGKYYELDYGNWGHSYCPKCGQAIDWSDEK